MCACVTCANWRLSALNGCAVLGEVQPNRAAVYRLTISPVGHPPSEAHMVSRSSNNRASEATQCGGSEAWVGQEDMAATATMPINKGWRQQRCGIAQVKGCAQGRRVVCCECECGVVCWR